jgi:hypothetical protein
MRYLLPFLLLIALGCKKETGTLDVYSDPGSSEVNEIFKVQINYDNLTDLSIMMGDGNAWPISGSSPLVFPYSYPYPGEFRIQVTGYLPDQRAMVSDRIHVVE